MCDVYLDISVRGSNGVVVLARGERDALDGRVVRVQLVARGARAQVPHQHVAAPPARHQRARAPRPRHARRAALVTRPRCTRIAHSLIYSTHTYSSFQYFYGLFLYLAEKVLPCLLRVVILCSALPYISINYHI